MSPSRKLLLSCLLSAISLLWLTACGTTQFVPPPLQSVAPLPPQALPQATAAPTWCLGDCLTQLQKRLQTRRETLQTLRATLADSSPVAASAPQITPVR